MDQTDMILLQAFGSDGAISPRASHQYAQRFAAQLYQQARDRRGWNALWAWLRHQPRCLASLAADRQGLKLRGCHAAGGRVVPLSRIVGSEGRRGDFDRWFAPLKNELKDRWLSVAVALYQGVALPLVELIQVGDVYYVRDGHHRLSVARALGQEEVEALVTVWEAVGPAAAQWSPTARVGASQLQPEGAP